MEYSWILSLLVLTLMELVLGIDNIIFIGIIANKLESPTLARKARQIGLAIALIFRLGALSLLNYLVHLSTPLFHILTTSGVQHPVSVRDLILILGGLFLIHKSATEIHELFDEKEQSDVQTNQQTFFKIILQIAVIDIVFSIDSILTAVGLVEQLEVMFIAVLISMVLMLLLAGKIAAFIESRPTLKVLALAFLIMIGGMLVMEGWGSHIDKSYIYFAMAFGLVLEALNAKIKRKTSRKRLIQKQ